MVAAVLLSSGCATGRPFDNSSADFNGGRFREYRTRGELETVADAVVAVMEANGAALVAAFGSTGVAELVGRKSGVSVTGAKESEVLFGLIAQLQRKRWQERLRPPAAPSNEAVDGAFEGTEHP